MKRSRRRPRPTFPLFEFFSVPLPVLRRRGARRHPLAGPINPEIET